MPKSRIAVLTFGAFLGALLYPYSTRAQQAPPPPPAPATSTTDEALQQAKTHFEAGKNAYNAGDYQTAIREFKAAEALRPSPILSYNIGLANEKLVRPRVAVKYYRRYLEQMPNAPNRPEVEQRIAAAEQQIAAQPAPPPGQPGAQPGEQPADMPPPQQGQVQQGSSYDPYASQAPPGSTPGQPVKKKSYWWVWLIVAGGATLIIGLSVWAYFALGGNGVSGNRSALTEGDPRSYDRLSPGVGASLFSF